MNFREHVPETKTLLFLWDCPGGYVHKKSLGGDESHRRGSFFDIACFLEPILCHNVFIQCKPYRTNLVSEWS